MSRGAMPAALYAVGAAAAVLVLLTEPMAKLPSACLGAVIGDEHVLPTVSDAVTALS